MKDAVEIRADGGFGVVRHASGAVLRLPQPYALKVWRLLRRRPLPTIVGVHRLRKTIWNDATYDQPPRGLGRWTLLELNGWEVQIPRRYADDVAAFFETFAAVVRGDHVLQRSGRTREE